MDEYIKGSYQSLKELDGSPQTTTNLILNKPMQGTTKIGRLPADYFVQKRFKLIELPKLT